MLLHRIIQVSTTDNGYVSKTNDSDQVKFFEEILSTHPSIINRHQAKQMMFITKKSEQLKSNKVSTTGGTEFLTLISRCSYFVP